MNTISADPVWAGDAQGLSSPGPHSSSLAESSALLRQLSRYSIRRAIHPVKTSHLQARFAWRIRIRQRAAGEAKLKRLLRVVERASEHPRFGARQELHPQLHWHELVPVRRLRPAGATRADPVLSSADASRPPDGLTRLRCRF